MPKRVKAHIPKGGQMPAPRDYESSEVELVNRCLRSIGEVPLPPHTLLDNVQLGTDVDIARRTVQETCREVLAVGWYFNTDYDFKLYKDHNSDEITVPDDVLRLDTYDDNQYVLKGNKIYDVYNNTYNLTPDYIEADVVWKISPENLTPESFEYIALRSARKFQEFVITAQELVQVTRAQEMDAYVRLQRRQLQTQAYNIQNARVSTRVHNGYLTRGLYRVKARR